MRAIVIEKENCSSGVWQPGRPEERGQHCEVSTEQRPFGNPGDEFSRTRLLDGLDDIAVTLRHERDITTFEAKRPEWLPRVR